MIRGMHQGGATMWTGMKVMRAKLEGRALRVDWKGF